MTGYQSKKEAAQDKMALPEQEPWPEEPFGHMAGGVQPAQRPWVYLTFEQRCRVSEQCLPEAPYREMLTKLHDEMLAALAQRPWVDLT